MSRIFKLCKRPWLIYETPFLVRMVGKPSEGWCMVRRKGAMPFCVRTEWLSDLPKPENKHD